MAWPCIDGLSVVVLGVRQGIVLAFAVSHNVREAKALAPGTLVAETLASEMARRDWGLQQVCTAKLAVWQRWYRLLCRC